MRLPPMPYSRRRAAYDLARPPLAAVRVDQLPRVWGVSGPEAAATLADLMRYNWRTCNTRPGISGAYYPFLIAY
jgi:hypothetical protein